MWNRPGFYLLLSIFLSLAFSILAACGSQKGSFFSAALGRNESRIIVTSSTTSGGILVYTVVMYDTNGRFLGKLADYASSGGYFPKGVIPFDGDSMIVAIDNSDRLDRLTYTGQLTIWAQNAQFTGTIYQIAKDLLSNIYVIETNTIERFDSSGTRVPATGATPYLPATVGGCTLNTPTDLAVDGNGRLIVTATGNDVLNIYDISSTTSASCVTSNTTSFAANDPYTVLVHSSGDLIVGTRVNDTIYRANSLGVVTGTIFNNTTYITDPTDIAEMPDGTLLVASASNSIERLDLNGNRYNGTVFIKDVFSTGITSVVVVRGE